MGDLYLNALPLSVNADPDTAIGRVWRRDDVIDAQLRNLEGRGQAFYHYSFNAYS